MDSETKYLSPIFRKQRIGDFLKQEQVMDLDIFNNTNGEVDSNGKELKAVDIQGGELLC